MYRGRLVGLTLSAALVSADAALAAQSAVPDSAVLTTVDTALKAAQSGNVKLLRTEYLPNCTFVDEFAPFKWSGPHSLDAYFASAARMYKDTEMTDTKVSHGAPSYVYTAGTSAYVVVPLRVRAKIGDRQYRAKGVLTFSLQKTADGWKIATQTWSKTAENFSPY